MGENDAGLGDLKLGAFGGDEFEHHFSPSLSPDSAAGQTLHPGGENMPGAGANKTFQVALKNETPA